MYISLLISIFLILPTVALSEDKRPEATLPLIEAPFNFENSYSYPSMRQSLYFSTSFYQSGHYYLDQKFSRVPRVPRRFIILGFDFLTGYLPLGFAWLHEEWHRAVMMNRDINSFNDVYYFPIGQDVIAVSHVEDDNLVRLKRDHPADQVRLSSAGMESEIAQNLLISKSHFFNDVQTFDAGLQIINATSVTGYLSTCASHGSDEKTTDMNLDEPTMKERDFTGLDCNAWVYDLFRPDEPYTARGAHPSGLGIDRYIKYSDLNEAEKNFLDRQKILSILNYANPIMFGFNSFNGDGYVWNASLQHSLTSFGYTVDANYFYRSEKNKFLLQFHNGFNNVRYFPGLTFQDIDRPLPWDKLKLTSSLTYWAQPKDQRFDAKSNESLAQVTGTVAYQITDDMKWLIGIDAKTPGWAMGNVFLDRNFTVWSGLSL